MLSLEEYISKRKREDKINEYDIDARMDNMRICVNYVFEYFNQYLNIEEMEQKTFLNEERLVKFRNQLEMYDNEIQEWLVNIYDVHEKHIHRSIISFLKKDELFFLYNKEEEFRSCSYDAYAQLIKKNAFLKGQTEMLFLFKFRYSMGYLFKCCFFFFFSAKSTLSLILIPYKLLIPIPNIFSLKCSGINIIVIHIKPNMFFYLILVHSIHQQLL